MHAADLNIDILNDRNSLNDDLKRLSFFLKNTRLIKLLILLRFTYILRLELAACNVKLKSRLNLYAVLLKALESYELQPQDLNEQLKSLNEQIDIFSFLQGETEKVLVFKNHKMLGDFEGTNRIISEILETLYTILRMYKKANKKTPGKTSQLAKDTAAHSMSTLSKIINGN